MIITTAAVWKCAIRSKNSSRPVLQHVHLDTRGESPRLMAADGFTLSVTGDIKLWEGEKVFDCNIPWKAVQYAQQVGGGKDQYPALKFCDNGWVVAGAVSNTGRSLVTDENWETMMYDKRAYPLQRNSDGELTSHWPDPETLMPKDEDLEYLVTFDARKLASVAESIVNKREPAIVTLKQRPGKPTSPIRVYSHVRDNTGVMMPCHITATEQEVPERRTYPPPTRYMTKALNKFLLLVKQDDDGFTVSARYGGFSIRGQGRDYQRALWQIVQLIGDLKAAPDHTGIDANEWEEITKPIVSLLYS